MTLLNLRDIEMFRPYEDEMPTDLLWAGGALEDQVEHWLTADILRIAKLSSEVLGMYVLHPGQDLTYLLHAVIVEPTWRKQGLGRWLVGHAIGVAESKGGRHVLFPGSAARCFFGHIGFVADAHGQRFDMIHE